MPSIAISIMCVCVCVCTFATGSDVLLSSLLLSGASTYTNMQIRVKSGPSTEEDYRRMWRHEGSPQLHGALPAGGRGKISAGKSPLQFIHVMQTEGVLFIYSRSSDIAAESLSQ